MCSLLHFSADRTALDKRRPIGRPTIGTCVRGIMPHTHVQIVGRTIGRLLSRAVVSVENCKRLHTNFVGQQQPTAEVMSCDGSRSLSFFFSEHAQACKSAVCRPNSVLTGVLVSAYKNFNACTTDSVRPKVRCRLSEASY